MGNDLRQTSLYARHVALGARVVEFGGWEMPVQYAGIVEEHRAVRTAAGLFDVSHMGEVEITGPGALASVQRIITNDAGRLAAGGGLYTPMCLPSGGIVDDLTVFRTGEERYLLIVNASTAQKDFAWIEEHTQGAQARNRSDEWGLLALQGPRALGILRRLTRSDLQPLPSFHIITGAEVAGVDGCFISRTGYTGEDGFEIGTPWDRAPRVWDALMEAGRPAGLAPVGLGARDTLRLEASYMLYGNDIDETTTPLEAPLSWTVKLEKGEFIGRDVLVKQKTEGTARRLVGFEMTERAIPRHGYALRSDGTVTGQVTSGTFGPWVQKSIGMGYVARAQAKPGNSLGVEIRGKKAGAVIVKLPFYKRSG
ncbi:MAG TPA: glycine cleavage system aminomethyltransferase GcvT [bacterium]